jgi:hypothetical protein
MRELLGGMATASVYLSFRRRQRLLDKASSGHQNLLHDVLRTPSVRSPTFGQYPAAPLSHRAILAMAFPSKWYQREFWLQQRSDPDRESKSSSLHFFESVIMSDTVAGDPRTTFFTATVCSLRTVRTRANGVYQKAQAVRELWNIGGTFAEYVSAEFPSKQLLRR